MKIALIDDSDVDRYLARRVLEAHIDDANVTEYESATDAVDPVRTDAQQNTPLVVFLDINMPRMSGFDFLDHVDDDIDCPPIVIIMLTSSGSKADRDAAAKYKCVKGYVEKPLTAAHLQDLDAALRSA